MLLHCIFRLQGPAITIVALFPGTVLLAQNITRVEIKAGAQIHVLELPHQPPGVGDPAADADGNGIPDGWEREHFGHVGIDPTADADGDGLNNSQEYQHGTQPNTADTDGDGLPDGQEIVWGTDPNDPGSAEAAAIVWVAAHTMSGTLPDTLVAQEGLPGFVSDSNTKVRYRKMEVFDEGHVTTYTFTGNVTWHYVNPGGNPSESDVSRGFVLNARSAYIALAQYLGVAFSATEIAFSATFKVTLSNPVDPVTIPGVPYEYTYVWGGGPPMVTRDFPRVVESVVYHLEVPEGFSGMIRWLEEFTPADNPDNKQYVAREWIVDGLRSPEYSMTPATNGTTKVLPYEAQLAADANRDGAIKLAGEDASDQTSTTMPYRFWINDDDDDGDLANQGLLTGNSDEPGKLAGFWELDGRTPDHAHAGVDGRCDLIDFFPIYLDIKQLLAVLPTTTAGIEYKLKQADAALNFVYTDLTRDHAFDYLTTEAATYGTNFDRLPHMAETAAITAEGVALSTTFLDKIKNGTDTSVILVEGVKPSDKPLRLVVVKAGVEIAEVAVNIKISEVEKMYRWVNLRGSLGQSSQSVTRPTDTSEPANYPDARTNGKMFIWVHGYNVNEQQSRAWAAEGFKRLYQSGSRAMYTFISWHGDHSQIANSVAPDYWDNITNAFRTSALLPGVVAALPGTSKIITGHSMGNVVVGSAIVDHGLSVTKYFMLNAAMALEAYDTSALNIPSMRRNEWASYDSRLWSTEWHQLFPGDGRAGLTWKNRFGDIPNAINFYSSGEEVLNNNDVASGGNPGEVPAVGSERAWVGQEMIKGTYHIGAVLTFDSQSGWGFNSAWDIAETTTTGGPHGGTTTTYRHRTPTEAAALTDAQLRTEPFFRRFQDDRLMTSGGSAAASEYITRADALGGAIPALSFPAGRNPIPRFDSQNRNVDLMTKQDGWGRSGGRWFHSDAKNMAYRYNYKLWDDWVDRGGLR